MFEWVYKLDWVDIGIGAGVTFASVVAGYYLAVRHERDKERIERLLKAKELEHLLENELSRISKRLEEFRTKPGWVDYLSTDMWEAAKSTGHLAFLETEKLRKIEKVYRLIELYNRAAYMLDSYSAQHVIKMGEPPDFENPTNEYVKHKWKRVQEYMQAIMKSAEKALAQSIL